MTRSQGAKREARAGTLEVDTSPGRMEMLRALRAVISACLDAEGEEMVEGRRRTVMLVVGRAFSEGELLCPARQLQGRGY